MAGAREAALQGLIAFRRAGAWPDLQLKKLSAELSSEDAALVAALTYGTLQNLSLIDFTLQQVSSMPLKKVMPQVLDALRLGVFQLLFLDRIPDSAAVNETVKLVKKHGGARAGGYANAVLRRLIALRDGGGLPKPDGPAERRLSVQYSHPAWFVRAMLERLGEEGTEELLRANNRPAKTTLRVNTLKTDSTALCALLAEQNIDCRPVEGLENALEAENMGNPAALRAFQEGLFYIQDAASQLCVQALDPVPGSFVIDMCAAPGGKTLLCAQRMRNQGRILAMDIHPHKAELIEQNAARYGAGIIQAIAADASKPVDKLRESADFVLCDVPCSGMGIIRKKPDIRFKKPEEIAGLPAVQGAILRTAAGYLNPGGRLVYSTCTVLRQENEDVVAQFVRDAAGWKIEDMKTLWPHIDGTDGFFIARLTRM